MTSIKRGTATVLAGETYVVVPHGLDVVPNIQDISLQPQDDLAGRDYWPSDPDAINFRINISTPDTESNHSFGYTIIVEAVILGTPTYCSADDVKAYSKITYTDLGYANDSTFETFLDSLIVLAQGVIENYCNVPSLFFAPDGKAFTNQLHDYRYPWVDLRYYPVLSVSKVEYNSQGYGITPTWVEVTQPDYIVKKDSGQVMLVSDVPAIPEQSIRVTYTAGYLTTPDPIKHVCIQICSNLVHEILQRKISPVMRVDDWNLKLIVPNAFTRELQVILAPFIRKSVAVG